MEVINFWAKLGGVVDQCLYSWYVSIYLFQAFGCKLQILICHLSLSHYVSYQDPKKAFDDVKLKRKYLDNEIILDQFSQISPSAFSF